MSLSFWELTQVLICRCRPLMKSEVKVVADYQHLIQLLHLQLLGCLGDLALPLDDAPQRRLVPLVPVSLLLFGIHAQYFLTGIQLSSILMDGLKI